MSSFVSGNYVYGGVPGVSYVFRFRKSLNTAEFERLVESYAWKVEHIYYGGNEITVLDGSDGTACLYESVSGSFFANSEDIFRNCEISGAESKTLGVLCEKYGIDEVIGEIDEMEDDETISDKELVLNFIKKLEGYQLRAKELHWSAVSKNRHTFIEGLADKIRAFEDSIAEDMMGYMGIRIKVGEVVPETPNCSIIEEFVKNLKVDTAAFYFTIKDNANCIGIVSETENFIHELNVSNYIKELS